MISFFLFKTEFFLGHVYEATKELYEMNCNFFILEKPQDTEMTNLIC